MMSAQEALSENFSAVSCTALPGVKQCSLLGPIIQAQVLEAGSPSPKLLGKNLKGNSVPSLKSLWLIP